MIAYLKKRHTTAAYKALCSFIAFAFLSSVILPPQVAAQLTPATVLNLPVPGTMVPVSSGFAPALMTGVTVNPDNPLRFDFIMDRGQSGLEGEALKAEYTRIIKYFMASLTVPEDELWVNLSPYEKDRMIAQGLGQTEMGRDMLAQDYLLKQLTASLMYPEEELGKKFWDKIYKIAKEKFGTTEIPVNTFNKVWIVPDEALVYEQGTSAFVIKSRLAVMLESDYEAAMGHQDTRTQGHQDTKSPDGDVVTGDIVTPQIIREIIIPEIEKEVNEGQNFANLRQIYNALILAVWYKQRLKDSLLGKVYVDQNKTKGIDTQDKAINQKIYDQYIESFKKGVYNFIKEDYDPATQQTIPRKYFSGGARLTSSPIEGDLELKELPVGLLRKLGLGLGAALLAFGISSVTPADIQTAITHATDGNEHIVPTALVENEDLDTEIFVGEAAEGKPAPAIRVDGQGNLPLWLVQAASKKTPEETLAASQAPSDESSSSPVEGKGDGNSIVDPKKIISKDNIVPIFFASVTTKPSLRAQLIKKWHERGADQFKAELIEAYRQDLGKIIGAKISNERSDYADQVIDRIVLRLMFLRRYNRIISSHNALNFDDFIGRAVLADFSVFDDAERLEGELDIIDLFRSYLFGQHFLHGGENDPTLTGWHDKVYTAIQSIYDHLSERGFMVISPPQEEFNNMPLIKAFRLLGAQERLEDYSLLWRDGEGFVPTQNLGHPDAINYDTEKRREKVFIATKQQVARLLKMAERLKQIADRYGDRTAWRLFRLTTGIPLFKQRILGPEALLGDVDIMTILEEEHGKGLNNEEKWQNIARKISTLLPSREPDQPVDSPRSRMLRRAIERRDENAIRGTLALIAQTATHLSAEDVFALPQLLQIVSDGSSFSLRVKADAIRAIALIGSYFDEVRPLIEKVVRDFIESNKTGAAEYQWEFADAQRLLYETQEHTYRYNRQILDKLLANTVFWVSGQSESGHLDKRREKNNLLRSQADRPGQQDTGDKPPDGSAASQSPDVTSSSPVDAARIAEEESRKILKEARWIVPERIWKNDIPLPGEEWSSGRSLEGRGPYIFYPYAEFNPNRAAYKALYGDQGAYNGILSEIWLNDYANVAQHRPYPEASFVAKVEVAAKKNIILIYNYDAMSRVSNYLKRREKDEHSIKAHIDYIRTRFKGEFSESPQNLFGSLEYLRSDWIKAIIVPSRLGNLVREFFPGVEIIEVRDTEIPIELPPIV